jgi:hypothetical protein
MTPNRLSEDKTSGRSVKDNYLILCKQENNKELELIIREFMLILKKVL